MSMQNPFFHGFLDGAGCPAGGPYCWGWVIGDNCTSLLIGFSMLGALVLGFLLGRWDRS